MKNSDRFKTEKIAAISGFGNWIGDLLLYPLDTISTRLKGNRDTHHKTFSFLKNSVRKDKMKLYRGVNLTFSASFIPTAIYVYVYERGMKFVQHELQQYLDHKNVKKARLYFPFFISFFAQLLCLIPYLPVDIVRTRIQMNLPQYSYNSFPSAIKTIYNNQGFSRLFLSGRAYIMCKTIYAGIQIQFFELIRYYVGPSNFWIFFNTIISTAIATTIMNPLEVLLTRYPLIDTTKSKNKITLWSVTSKIYQREGFKGFYKGFGTELVSHCLYALFWLPLYQHFREKYDMQIEQ